jgi:4-hydroxy-tetrahydrodipicolinate reductase
MRILILGYGKMGKAIEEIAEEHGHEIKHKININNTQALKFIDTAEIDVAIEFSQPDAAFDNIRFCLEHHIPVVSGTTGWLDKRSEVEALCRNTNGAFFYSSNFSLGVNLMFKLNKILANLMAQHTGYRASITEVHHTEKKDAPSGTAITLAEAVLANIPGLDKWVNHESDDEQTLPIISERLPDVPGTHTVKYHSTTDDIEITHTAHSRTGFALGAVLVAEWILDKKGVLTMDDFMNF